MPSLTDDTTVILSDELNHASIVDAVRLSKPARKIVDRHSDLGELREGLASCERGQRKLVLTDGVFSMEGDLARLPEILELAREYDATVLVDDSHGVGVMGATGGGVAEHFGVLGEVDVITGTLGKALGGAAGGTSQRAPRSATCSRSARRPQLFSNALPPTVACSARAALEVLEREPELIDRLRANTDVLPRPPRRARLRAPPGEARSSRSSSARPQTRSPQRSGCSRKVSSSPASASRSSRRGRRGSGSRCPPRSRRSCSTARSTRSHGSRSQGVSSGRSA